MKATLCIDEAVGEMRRALLDVAGRPFRLDIERWSERDKRAKLEEVWWGRVYARTPGGRGWFIELGLEALGIIEGSKAGVLVEGALVPVRVKSEAHGDKGPVLSLADMKADVTRPAKPSRHAEPPDDPFLRGVEIVATIRDHAARTKLDAAIEEGLSREVAIPHGGELTIERTAALTAIDVDAGKRTGPADPEEFMLQLNLAAAEVAARQVGLRGLGGVVAIDFVTMVEKKNRRHVVETFRGSLQQWLGRASEVADLSPFGICEAGIARRQRPLADALKCAPEEREGLDTIRLIESEGRANAGSKLKARVSADALKWLEADAVHWKAALAGRIGMRWTLEAVQRRPGPPEVWSET
jgi:hypothetical protein